MFRRVYLRLPLRYSWCIRVSVWGGFGWAVVGPKPCNLCNPFVGLVCVLLLYGPCDFMGFPCTMCGLIYIYQMEKKKVHIFPYHELTFNRVTIVG